MPLTEKQQLIQGIIDELLGSSGSLSDACEERGLSDMDDEVTTMVDNQIFECTVCGWWCPIEEESSEAAEFEHLGLSEWTCLQCCEDMT